jgi:hypothetical protein
MLRLRLREIDTLSPDGSPKPAKTRGASAQKRTEPRGSSMDAVRGLGATELSDELLAVASQMPPTKAAARALGSRRANGSLKRMPLRG